MKEKENEKKMCWTEYSVISCTFHQHATPAPSRTTVTKQREGNQVSFKYNCRKHSGGKKKTKQDTTKLKFVKKKKKTIDKRAAVCGALEKRKQKEENGEKHTKVQKKKRRMLQ